MHLDEFNKNPEHIIRILLVSSANCKYHFKEAVRFVENTISWGAIK